MQTSWNGDKTILQSINNTIATILQNTNVSMNSDVYNTTEIQNIKNSITGISTNVQATSGRDRYYYMLVKPTVAGGSLAFKDMPTIAKITNDDENVEMGIFPCTYNTDTFNMKFFIDGFLEDDITQIFNFNDVTSICSNNVKNMNLPYLAYLKTNGKPYVLGDYANDEGNTASNNAERATHQHIINNIVNNNFNISASSNSDSYYASYCTSKYFKTIRLKALYYGSYLIVVKTKGTINYVDNVTMNTVIGTLDGTTNFQEDSVDSANFKHYNYNNGTKSTNIYLQESAIVIPPTLI